MLPKTLGSYFYSSSTSLHHILCFVIEINIWLPSGIGRMPITSTEMKRTDAQQGITYSSHEDTT
jgi:hypothetical protein